MQISEYHIINEIGKLSYSYKNDLHYFFRNEYWYLIFQFKVTSNEEEKFDNEAWIQQFSSKGSTEESLALVPSDKTAKKNVISKYVVYVHFLRLIIVTVQKETYHD